MLLTPESTLPVWLDRWVVLIYLYRLCTLYISYTLQSWYLEPLTPTKADTGLYGELVGCFTGASERRWVSMILVAAKVSRH